MKEIIFIFLFIALLLASLNSKFYLRFVYLLPVVNFSSFFEGKIVYLGAYLSFNSIYYIFIIFFGFAHIPISKIKSKVGYFIFRFKYYILFVCWLVILYTILPSKIYIAEFIRGILIILTPLIVAIVSFINSDKIKLQSWLYSNFLILLFLLIIGIPFNLTYIEYDELGKYGGLTNKLTQGNRIYAGFLELVLCYIFAKIAVLKRINFREISAIVIIVLLIILSGSRTITLSTLIMGLFLIKEFKLGKKTLLALFILLTLLAIFYQFRDLFIQRMFFQPGGSMDLSNIDSKGRFFTWGILLSEIFNNPIKAILGHGFFSSIYFLKDVLGTLEPYHPHNDYLRILYDAGIIGFMLYYFLFIIGMLRFVKKYSFMFGVDRDLTILSKTITYAIVFFLIISFTDNYFLYSLSFQNILFSIIGVYLGKIFHKKSNPNTL